MSFHPHHILAATDFSSCSRKALDVALAVAQTYDAALTLVHVISPSVLPDFAATSIGPPISQLEYLASVRDEVEQNFLEDQRHLRAKGAKATVLTRQGGPADQILRLVQQEQFDLVVLGTHGRSGLRHLLAGSVAEAVVRRCPVPVLTIREAFSEAPVRLLHPTAEVEAAAARRPTP